MAIQRLLVLALFLSSTHLFANSKWSLEAEEDLIRVFTKKHEGTDYKAFRAEMLVSGSNLEKVFSYVEDIKNYSQWVPGCEGSDQLEVKGKKIGVLQYDLPFPFEDRIFTQNIDLLVNTPKLKKLRFKSVAEKIDVKFKGVPALDSEFTWTLEQREEGLLVVYQGYSNPGGNLPAWLVNTKVVETPLGMLASLREKLSLKSVSMKATNKKI